MIIGHSMSNGEGVIQAIDESVATLLQRTQKQLVGMSFTAITHPGDLANNLAQIMALQPNARSARIRKRYLGGEGAIIPVEVQVSRLGSAGVEHLVGTFSTLPTLTDFVDKDPMPHRLWRRAQDLLRVMGARNFTLGSDLFADHAWTALLIVYVAEAESQIATLDMIANRSQLSRTTLSRWIRVLQSKQLLEPCDPECGALQLTSVGIEKVEGLLSTHTSGSTVKTVS